MVRTRIKSLVLLPALFLLAGCMAGKTALPRIFWPPPPEEPQIEFLGVFASRDDFPKTRWEEFLEEAFGKPPFVKLRSPSGVFTDGAGKVYVLDARERIFYVFDIREKNLEFLFGGLLPLFDEPVDAVPGPEGNLYVLDRGKKKVIVFTSEMKPLFSFGEAESLGRPESLAIHKGLNRLYISDAENNRIEVYDLRGRRLFAFGAKGKKAGEFRKPHGLAIDAGGRLFVADTGNARIQVFDAEGSFLHLFGNFEEDGSPFSKPRDLAFDSQGNLHVIDRGAAAFLTFSPRGDFLFATGAQGPTNHLLGLSNPAAIYIDPVDRIIITDKFNRRFSLWQCLHANYLSEHPVTDGDIHRMVAFSEQLKKKDEEGRRKGQEVHVAKEKKPANPIQIIRLRTLEGAPVDFPEKRFKVLCPNCGIGIELAGKTGTESVGKTKSMEKEAKRGFWRFGS